MSRLHRRYSRISAGLEPVGTWLERLRYRRQLARLDDHLLDDVGIQRRWRDDEVQKPFWRA